MKLQNIWHRKWVLSAAAGTLLGLSFSPFPFPFLLFPAFILLFRISELCSSYREVAYFSYPAFLIWNIIGTYWLIMATVTGGIAAILANSAIMSLTFGLMYLVITRFNNSWLPAFFIAGIWTSYEWLHLQWDLAWPWLILANAWSTHTWAVQYIEYTGFLSVSFLTIVVSYFLYEGIRTSTSTSTSANSGAEIPANRYPFWETNSFLSGIVIWLFSALLSFIILFTLDTEPEETIHVVIAQPNYDSYLSIGGYNDTTTPLMELTTMLDSVITDRTEIMFWPENALMGRVDQLFRSADDRHILAKSAEWNVPIITGAAYFRYYPEDEVPRVHRTNNAGRPFNFFNSAVGYYPDGLMDVYKKIRLVPIVERIPFAHTLSRLPLPIDWGSVTGYGRGEEMVLFEATQSGILSPAVVCYDSVFPDVVRRSVAKDAGFITVITNDGWWGNTSGHIQHYEFARLRAIENRRTALRSANNGISGMIAANGRPVIKTEYWTRTAFEVEVPVYTNKTFYVRNGDWFNLISLAMAIAGILSIFIKRSN